MPDKDSPPPMITASDLANYVVCPEQWRLKVEDPARRKQAPTDAQRLREEWVQKQDLSAELRWYAKLAYILLVIIAIVVFLLDQRRVEHRLRHKSSTAGDLVK